MKHKISEIGAQMLKYQEQLAREYKYKPIPRTFFSDVRAKFQKALPEWCNVSGDTISLETTNGTVITNGYNRIVIGDYGAFVEFSRVQACIRVWCSGHEIKTRSMGSYYVLNKHYLTVNKDDMVATYPYPFSCDDGANTLLEAKDTDILTPVERLFLWTEYKNPNPIETKKE